MKREELEATLKQAMQEHWAGDRWNDMVDRIMKGQIQVQDTSRVEANEDAEFKQAMNAELAKVRKAK